MSVIPIATTRFNNETHEENVSYRNRMKMEGCIYGSPQPITSRIDLNSLVFIIEMNNSTNKILGIGLIRNMTQIDRYYRVYDTGNYNRYIYKSNYRISREEINPLIVEILEQILFKGKTHLKRGSGITQLPDKLLKHPICEGVDLKREIKKEFQKRFEKLEENYTEKKEN
jgi:hypothetical protein